MNSDTRELMRVVPVAFVEERNRSEPRSSSRRHALRLLSDSFKNLRGLMSGVRSVLRALLACHVGRGKLLVYAESRNQWLAMQGVVEGFGEKGAEVALMLSDQTEQPSDVPFIYPTALQLLAFLAFPVTWKNIRAVPSFKLDVPYSLFQAFCMTPVLRTIWLLLLRRMNPAGVLVASEISLVSRALLSAARECSIGTYSLQHGSVSSSYPGLLADFAFLDGEHAFQSFRGKENLSQVLLAGGTRFESLRELRERREPLEKRVVGVGVSVRDDIQEVISTCRLLNSSASELRVRFHPRQKKGDVQRLEELCLELGGVTLSSPFEETVEEYLERITVFVGSNTSLHVETLLSGLPSVYLLFGEGQDWDLLGLLEEELVRSVTSKTQLNDALDALECQETNLERLISLDAALANSSNLTPTKLIVGVLENGVIGSPSLPEGWIESTSIGTGVYVYKEVG